MTHLLVTNDFPPKVGGIQSYLYELWRRIPKERFAVLTIAHEGAEAFDRAQDFAIRRLNLPMLTPRQSTRAEIERYAREVGASHVVLDPLLPIGLVGPRLSLSFSLVVHGAEITVPGHLPVTRHIMSRAISRASLIIAAGGYPAEEVRRIAKSSCPPIVSIPPGVDVARFVPLGEARHREARTRFGVSQDELLVVSVSRLVPRKGMDVLISAAAELRARYPKLVVLIGGTGRDAKRLARLIDRTHAPVRLLGRIDDADLASFFGIADVAAMVCRNRWFGLEQEGFGIVFLEAAATGVATLAGDSGGAGEAVVDAETGYVVRRPSNCAEVVRALDALLSDPVLRARFGHAGRVRAEQQFDYDGLAQRLDRAIAAQE